MEDGILWDKLFTLKANVSIWEIAMLITFAASWPAAILKTYTSKNPGGKSLLFASLIIIGYICGSVHKLLYQPDLVFWLYWFNTFLVATDAFLVILYRRRLKNQQKATL